jgi:TATA-box binding protein (TBP) (component of TFIID and TFIIIB)
MSIVNINYRGRITCKIDDLQFPETNVPPKQLVIKCDNGEKLLVFTSGKCRLMGCKSPVHSVSHYPIPIVLTNIVSATAVMNMEKSIDIRRMANDLGNSQCSYEPELFPALRLRKFNPLCVNVFASGKIVILGLKELKINKLCSSIRHVVCQYNF